MKADLEISARATRQIFSALDWWHDHRTIAPDLLSEEIERALDVIARQPRSGSPVANNRYSDLRRYYLGKSGYWLFYRVSGDNARILALWHERRGRAPRL